MENKKKLYSVFFYNKYLFKFVWKTCMWVCTHVTSFEIHEPLNVPLELLVYRLHPKPKSEIPGSMQIPCRYNMYIKHDDHARR